MDKTNSLKKELTLLDVFCIATGAMISSGLFILPAIAFLKVGPSLFLSYIIASCLAIPAMLSKAELVTAMPKSGGDYFFISRSMGLGVGTIGGLASWFSLSLKSAFALIGMSAYVGLIANVDIRIIAVALCLFFVAINIIGIREAGFFQRYLVIGLLIALGIYVIRGFPAIKIDNFIPFVPNGTKSIIATAGFVFISYGGLTKIASVSEEVKKPGRNIPLGMILSLIVSGFLYAFVIFITTGVLDPQVFASTLTPISDSARMFMGPIGAVILAVAAILAFISTANAGIMSASRYPIAMSRDKALPAFFKNLNQRFKTPHISIIFTGIFMILAIYFLDLESLVKVASTFLIILYLLANLAVIIMRESKIQNYQPKFKAPLYPAMQILGILASGFLLFEMGRKTYFTVLIIVAITLIWYMIYVRPNVKKEYALVHVIERVTAKELSTSSLEKELMEILRERDDVVEDRFDKLVIKCRIVDFDNPLSMEEFFKKSGELVAKDIDMNQNEIYKLLVEREEESSTVIRPGLAIPHIVVPGDRKFDILLARCKAGITFPKTKGKVHIVFVLYGSKDERNFHLRALAAIAEIAQSKNFDKIWLGARNTEDLRNIILTAERRRFSRK